MSICNALYCHTFDTICHTLTKCDAMWGRLIQCNVTKFPLLRSPFICQQRPKTQRMPILAKRFNVRSGEVGMGPLTTELLLLKFCYQHQGLDRFCDLWFRSLHKVWSTYYSFSINSLKNCEIRSSSLGKGMLQCSLTIALFKTFWFPGFNFKRGNPRSMVFVNPRFWAPSHRKCFREPVKNVLADFFR